MSTTQNHSIGCTATEEDLLGRVRQLAANYKGKEGSLIQVLHMVQSVYGYLPLNVQQIVAEELELPLSTVSGVVSFYSFFATTRGAVIRSGSVWGQPATSAAASALSTHWRSSSASRPAERRRTASLHLKLPGASAPCGLAPAMLIDDTVYPEVKASDLAGILEPWYHEDK